MKVNKYGELSDPSLIDKIKCRVFKSHKFKFISRIEDSYIELLYCECCEREFMNIPFVCTIEN